MLHLPSRSGSHIVSVDTASSFRRATITPSNSVTQGDKLSSAIDVAVYYQLAVTQAFQIRTDYS